MHINRFKNILLQSFKIIANYKQNKIIPYVITILIIEYYLIVT